MQTKFDPKAKVKQGQFSESAYCIQPNNQHTNIDFAYEAPGKGEADIYLKKADYPSESGSKHVDDAVFRMADEKDY